MEKAGRGKTENPDIKLHPAERRLIEYIRALGYGRIEVRVHQSLPFEIERSVEKVKLVDKD